VQQHARVSRGSEPASSPWSWRNDSHSTASSSTKNGIAWERTSTTGAAQTVKNPAQRPIPRANVPVRRHLICALAAALLALGASPAAAQPVDPATLGQPVAAPGCPDSAPDCVPPDDTTSLGGGYWFTTPGVDVTLTGEDAGSGLAGMEYAVDSGDIASGAANEIVHFSGEGAHSLAHRALDVDGNASGWALDDFGIDSAPPVNTTAVVDPAPRQSATVAVTATDSGSGVDVVRWQLDGGTVQSGPSGSQVTIAADGPHTLRTWAVDVAGNLSPSRDDPIAIDAVAPVDTSVVAAGWRTSAPALVTLSGTDGSDPATAMEYQLDGTALQTVADGGTVSVAADGIHSLKHRAVDAVGNRSAWVTDTVRLDATNPVNTSVASAAWRDPDQHVIVSGTDATSGVASVQYQLDGGAISSASSGADVLVTGDGLHSVRTRVLDVAGNQSAWRTDTVRIDTVTPVDLTAPPAGWQTAAVPVAVQGYDEHSGVASVEWSLDGAPAATVAAASTTVMVSGDGQHTLRTRVTDALGHQTGWKSSTVRVDTTTPANTTDAVPTAWQSGRVAVELDGADAGSGLFGMEWILDGAPVQSGAAGTVVAVSADGTHTLQSRARDVAGNASAWRSDSIRIDTVKPADTTSIPATVAYGVKATLTGADAASGVDTVEWQLDGTPGSGASGAQVALGGAGSHALAHRVLDKAGNASPWKTDTVTVDPTLNHDTTPPVDTTAVPSAWQTSSPVVVAVTGTDASTAVDHVQWRTDGGSPQSGPSGSTLSLSGDGQHHFETRVFDVVGNATQWVDRVVRIDGASPFDATAVPAWQHVRTVTLAGGDATSGVKQMEWWIDGGARATGPAGTVITLPADGTYTLEHRAVDNADNTSARRTDVVHVDTVEPVDTTPTAPAGWSTAAWTVTPSGSDAGSGVATVEARLDGDPVAGTPVVVDTDGQHTFATRVTDVAGNVSDWRSQTVRIDLHAPSDTTTEVPAGWRNTPWTGTAAADDGAGSGVTLLEWRLGTTGTISTDPAITVSGEGATVLMTRATDAAGHRSAWRSQTVRIDTADPVVALDCGDAGWRTTPASCAVSADGGPSGLASLTLARGDGAPTAVAPGDAVPIAADGAWTVTLAAADGAGNAATASDSVQVDTTPPVVTLDCAPSAEPTGYACAATGADATSGVDTLRWRTAGGAWHEITGDGTFAVASGSVEVRATDVAGLATTSPATVLAERTVPAPVVTPPAPTPPVVVPAAVRTRSVSVRRRGVRGADGLLGAFALSSARVPGEAADATADVRPLALGAGSFRVTIRLVSGQLTAKRVRLMRFTRGGHSPRMGVALSGVTRAMRAELTVERRSGRRWVRVATAAATLKP
jgi:hypothetical protein